ncbi:MAG: hypothetical protein RL701_7308 [Pseudomonadota bacterium]
MLEPDAGLPAQIHEWAEVCRGFVKEALGIELDYTPETLPLLDHYVRSKAKPASDEVRGLLTPPLGAYFGEVVRRRLDAEGVRWHAPGDDYEHYRLEFEAFFLHFNPLGVAIEALTDDDATGYGAHFQVLDDARPQVEAALAANESVSAEDYYTFTMRFETLELVAAILLGFEDTQHAGQPRRFSREVYRAATGEASTKDSLS